MRMLMVRHSGLCMIRDCMLQACNEMLGRAGRKQPDLFVAAQRSL